MRKSYKEDDTQEMIVFRVPNKLAEQASQRAQEMMVSKSAICRQALSQFLFDVKEYPTY
tara:strand:+ start:88 stop:264 length:177 start_codon:yes stop_codon:yes gene_type:complete